MQRLFSTFPDGWPGLGLLLLRAVAGLALIQPGLITVVGATPPPGSGLAYVAAGAGLLLVLGLWTPVAGAVSAGAVLWVEVSRIGEPATCVGLGVLCCAIVMLGPGAWSIDARLFGRMRLSIDDRR